MTADTSIIVTGAGSGIGAALARRLARPGLRLTLNTRSNKAGLDRVAAAAREAGAEVITVLADMREADSAERLVAAAADAFGAVDALVPVAGFADATPLGEIEDAGMVKSFETIDLAFVRLLRQAVPLLARSERGRVVAVSSFVAHRFQLDGRYFPTSAMAKAGLEALVKAFAAELAGQGITVNGVVPGFIEKDKGAHRAVGKAGYRRAVELIPQGRLGQPDEVAAAIQFLLSADASYITGQCLHVDGGLTL